MQIRHFSKPDWHSADFGLSSPVIQKIFQRKCATAIVERVRIVEGLRFFFRKLLPAFPACLGGNRSNTTHMTMSSDI